MWYHFWHLPSHCTQSTSRPVTGGNIDKFESLESMYCLCICTNRRDGHSLVHCTPPLHRTSMWLLASGSPAPFSDRAFSSGQTPLPPLLLLLVSLAAQAPVHYWLWQCCHLQHLMMLVLKTLLSSSWTVSLRRKLPQPFSSRTFSVFDRVSAFDCCCRRHRRWHSSSNRPNRLCSHRLLTGYCAA